MIITQKKKKKNNISDKSVGKPRHQIVLEYGSILPARKLSGYALCDDIVVYLNKLAVA